MLFTKITNKEDSMKSEKSKAELSAAEKLGEAIVLHPEWEVKPKNVEMTHEFVVSFNESTKKLTLTVNGEVYREMDCKDILSGKIKFHQGIQEINQKFNLWKYDDKN